MTETAQGMQDGAGGTAGPGTAGPGTAGPGTAGPGTAGPGTAGPGTAGPGTAGSGTPQPAKQARSAVLGPIGGYTRPLAETDFVVVDLETTGGSPDHAVIIEIGAVRLRGGPEAAERPAAGSPASDEPVFSALVDPGRPIPAHISALTGITGDLIAGAPRIGQVLPAFLEFAAGAVVVAHNAPFDLAFLTAACESHGLAWPAVPVLDTAALARRVLTTQEAPDCRLGTLARMFGHAVPGHRALEDASATAAVLRGLIGRLAALGVCTLDRVREITDSEAGCPPGPHRERMLELTADIPAAPGICLFLGGGGEVLHVVKSSDMRGRVRGYFAVSETRNHIRELLDRTERLRPASQPTALAADVEEIRLIARHHPRYNEHPRFNQAPVSPGTPELGAPGTPELGATGTPELGATGTPELGATGIRELGAARRVVATAPRFDGGWDLAVIEDGLLTRSEALPPDADLAAPAGVGAEGPAASLERPAASPGRETGSSLDTPAANTFAEGPAADAFAEGPAASEGREAGPSAEGSVAERAFVLRWLASPGVRVIDVDW